MKSASSVEEAIRELFPKLREVAVRPVIDQDDLTERSALHAAAFEVQMSTYSFGVDPEKVAPGWTEHYLALQRENVRAGAILEQTQSVAGRLEFERYTMMREGRPPIVTPDLHPDPKARFLHSKVFPTMTAGDQNELQKRNVPAGAVHLKMSEVLQRFLDQRETQDGDRRAESEIGPIVKFATELLGDPIMMDITGDQLLKLKKAIPDIPTPFGFSIEQRANLYARWKHIEDSGWTFQRDKETIKFKKTSETTINRGWRIALTTLWEFAIEHRFAVGPVPDFEIVTNRNPGAVERDAPRTEELIAIFSAPAFGGCAGRSRLWTAGKFFYQGFLYWAELICLLCGMRPGEIAHPAR